MTNKTPRELLERSIDLLEQADLILTHSQDALIDPTSDSDAQQQVMLYQYLMQMSQVYSVTAYRAMDIAESERKAAAEKTL